MQTERTTHTSRKKTDFDGLSYNCGLDSPYLPQDLDQETISQLSRIVQCQSQPLVKGDYLYQAGESFRGLFSIKSGSAKIVTSEPHGEEHIVDFMLPGELFGFDALFDDIYHNSAIALETMSFCELPSDRIDALCVRHPAIYRALFRHAGEKINYDTRQAVLQQAPADERLAAFLLNLSERLQRRGFSPLHFQLSLQRQEISDYLNLALATVSRLLRQFQNKQLIVVSYKSIQIINIEGLKAIYNE